LTIKPDLIEDDKKFHKAESYLPNVKLSGIFFFNLLYKIQKAAIIYKVGVFAQNLYEKSDLGLVQHIFGQQKGCYPMLVSYPGRSFI
jgi:hypothetical protein